MNKLFKYLFFRPVDKELTRGDTLQLHCSFEAFPTPRVSWFHNKSALMVRKNNYIYSHSQTNFFFTRIQKELK